MSQSLLLHRPDIDREKTLRQIQGENPEEKQDRKKTPRKI
jgi:hypothetical protein